MQRRDSFGKNFARNVDRTGGRNAIVVEKPHHLLKNKNIPYKLFQCKVVYNIYTFKICRKTFSFGFIYVDSFFVVLVIYIL